MKRSMKHLVVTAASAILLAGSLAAAAKEGSAFASGPTRHSACQSATISAQASGAGSMKPCECERRITAQGTSVESDMWDCAVPFNYRD